MERIKFWKVLIIFAFLFQPIVATPTFFYNPFNSARASEEPENVSVYTTESPTNSTTSSPAIYLLLVKGVFDSITNRIGSVFRSPEETTTEKSSRIVSTTAKYRPMANVLEIVEDSTESKNVSSNELVGDDDKREEIDPSLIKNNPSFMDNPMNEDSKPVRYVDLKSVEERHRTHDDTENEIETDNRNSTDKGIEDEDEDDEDEDIDFPDRSDENDKERMGENGVILLVEYVAQMVTLAWGVINALFQTRMK